MPDYDAILEAPPCRLGAVFSGDALIRLDFLPVNAPPATRLDARGRLLAEELAAYWHDPAHRFRLAVDARGTPFQLRVWQALQTLAPGAPVTYGSLARRLGTAARAVGQACGANPLPILIPCHRVVAVGGLGGFMHHAAGAPLNVKSWLLAHESAAAH